MKKRSSIIVTMLIIITAVIIMLHSMVVTGASTYYDFEDKSFKWNSLYGDVAYEFISEETGNTYMKLSYNGGYRSYYDVAVAGTSFSNYSKLQISYDVMYEEFTSDRNGEIQIKERHGPGSTETTLVARVAQLNGYLQVQGGDGVGFQRIRDLNGQYYQMETNHWYTIKIIVDMGQHIQSIYVFDRDTQSLVAIHQEISTISDISHINMVSFTSSSSICLDNVGVSEYSCEDCYIYGSPFLKKGNKTRYYFLGKGMDDTATALPYGDTIWSIVNPRSGVSINSSSGNLNTSTAAEPGIVIIKALRTIGDETFEARYSVDITN